MYFHILVFSLLGNRLPKPEEPHATLKRGGVSFMDTQPREDRCTNQASSDQYVVMLLCEAFWVCHDYASLISLNSGATTLKANSTPATMA